MAGHENMKSVHLPPDRRDQFRRARQALLDARGCETQFFDAGRVDELLHRSQVTPLDVSRSGKPKPASRFALLDRRNRMYPLGLGTNTIGRLRDNDVVVSSPQVSRRHCAVLVHSNDVCEVHDFASKNGTYVNGKRIFSPTRIQPGDELMMSDYHLIFLGCDTDGGTGTQANLPDA